MNVQFFTVIIIVLCAIVTSTIAFVKLPREIKIQNVKEWLKYAVAMAEKELGSGTGQLKLRKVYNMAVTQFPWLVQLVTFEIFSVWVDEALDWMKKQMEDNKAVQNYVNNAE